MQRHFQFIGTSSGISIHMDNSPETLSQHTFGQEFSFQDPVPNVLKVLGIPHTEKFPLRLEQADHMENRDNIDLTV